jgi:molybdate transport system regulatory protein
MSCDNNGDGMKQERFKLRLKLWIDADGENAFGPGSAALLKGVEETGSLAGAARALGMSYRAAWGRVRKIEARLGEAVLRKRGGNKAGYELTARGHAMLVAYEALFEEMDTLAQARFQELFASPESAVRVRDE